MQTCVDARVSVHKYLFYMTTFVCVCVCVCISGGLLSSSESSACLRACAYVYILYVFTSLYVCVFRFLSRACACVTPEQHTFVSSILSTYEQS